MLRAGTASKGSRTHTTAHPAPPTVPPATRGAWPRGPLLTPGACVPGADPHLQEASEPPHRHGVPRKVLLTAPHPPTPKGPRFGGGGRAPPWRGGTEANGQAPWPWRMEDRAAETARPQHFLWAPGSHSCIILRPTIRDQRGKCPCVADGAPGSWGSLPVSSAPSPGPRGFQNKTTHASSGPAPAPQVPPETPGPGARSGLEPQGPRSRCGLLAVGVR